MRVRVFAHTMHKLHIKQAKAKAASSTSLPRGPSVVWCAGAPQLCDCDEVMRKREACQNRASQPPESPIRFPASTHQRAPTHSSPSQVQLHQCCARSLHPSSACTHTHPHSRLLRASSPLAQAPQRRARSSPAMGAFSCQRLW